MRLSLALQVFDILKTHAELSIKECHQYCKTADAKKVKRKIKRSIFPHGTLRQRVTNSVATSRAQKYVAYFKKYVRAKNIFQVIIWFQHATRFPKTRNPIPKRLDLHTPFERVNIIGKNYSTFKNFAPTQFDIVKFDYFRDWFPYEFRKLTLRPLHP